MKIQILFLLFLFCLLNCYNKDEIENKTIYSSEFKKDKFTKNLIGKSKDEIIKIIGKPLEENQMCEFDAFIYSDNYKNLDFYEGFDFVNSKDEKQKSNYIFLSFKNGKVKTANLNGFPNVDEKTLNGKTKEEIIKEFGEPDKKIYCDKQNSVMSYSDRSNGNIGNKMPKYYVKNIILNKKNIAIKIIDTINNDLNRIRFACEE